MNEASVQKLKILVAVKQVIDYHVKIRVNSDESGIEQSNVKHTMNPFDEIALEEAVRLREQGIASGVIAISLGPESVKETLTQALAMGADRAIHVATSISSAPCVENDMLSSVRVAQILKRVATEESVNLVLLGKQSIDSDANQTGQTLAGLLEWSQATFASQLRVDLASYSAQVVREVDTGLETLTVTLPAVVTTDLRLNEPRYPTLPNIMKAKSKPLATKQIGDFGGLRSAAVQIQKISTPQQRPPGKRVKTVQALAEILKETGCVRV